MKEVCRDATQKLLPFIYMLPMTKTLTSVPFIFLLCFSSKILEHLDKHTFCLFFAKKRNYDSSFFDINPPSFDYFTPSFDFLRPPFYYNTLTFDCHCGPFAYYCLAIHFYSPSITYDCLSIFFHPPAIVYYGFFQQNSR